MGADDQNDLFIAGVIFVMGAYHLALFALRRKETPPLWFSLFCLSVGLRQVLMGHYLETRFPGLPGGDFRDDLEWVVFYTAVPTFVVEGEWMLQGALDTEQWVKALTHINAQLASR